MSARAIAPCVSVILLCHIPWAAQAVAQVAQIGTRASIDARLSPAVAPSGLGIAIISWTTDHPSGGGVFVAQDDGREELVAQGSTGSLRVDWIQPNSTYYFRLYTVSQPRRLLASTRVTLSREAVAAPAVPPATGPLLKVTREPGSVASGMRAVLVEWDARPRSSARVEVSENGLPPRLFASGAHGSARADWIDSASTYEFRLYAADVRAPLAIVRMGHQRTPGLPIAPIGAIAVLLLGATAIVRLARRIQPFGIGWKALGLIVTTIWIAIALAIDPAGEFPLNDDWAYAWSVKTLLEGGGFQLSDWTAVNLAPQVMWGWMFSVPGGFSFTALRVSTLVAGLAVLIAMLALLRDAGARPVVALVSVLAVALNPITLALSYSFNTDIPSLALFTGALFAVARGLGGSRVWLRVGVALSIVAVLHRQTNVVLLPAIGAGYIIAVGMSPRSLIKACLPTVIGVSLHIAYSSWLEATGRRPALFGFQIGRLLDALRQDVHVVSSVYLENLVTIGLYLGLFLFPVLVLAHAEHLQGVSRRGRIASWIGVAVVAVLGLAWLDERRLPLAGNVLERAGVGPQVVPGYYAVLGPEGMMFVQDAWLILTVVGLVGAGMLGGALVRALTLAVRSGAVPVARRAQTVFVASTLLLLFGGIGGLPPNMWFDRYLLPFAVPAIAMIVMSSMGHAPLRQTAATIAVATLLAFGIFGVAATHDLLASTGARWRGYEDVIGRGAARPSDIADWDYAGWHFGQRLEQCNPRFDRSRRYDAGWDDFTCLAGSTEGRVTAMHEPIAGDVVASHSYRRWLPPDTRTVFVMRRPVPPESIPHPGLASPAN